MFVQLQSQSAFDVIALPGKDMAANRTRSGLALGAIKPQPHCQRQHFHPEGAILLTPVLSGAGLEV